MKRLLMACMLTGLLLATSIVLASPMTSKQFTTLRNGAVGHQLNKPIPAHQPKAAPTRAKSSVVRQRSTVASSLPPEVYYPAEIAFQGYMDDGSWGPFPIGFNFPFFDSTYTEFYVTSNGFLAFDSAGLEISDGSGWSEYGNSCLPNASTPNGMICAFWNDIVVHQNGGVIYYQAIGEAPNRKLVVQCTNMGQYGEPTLLGTFFFILYETSNEIQIQYRIIVDNSSDWAHGQDATVGIENWDGTQAVEYSCSETSLSSEQAIRFIPDGEGSYTVDSSALYDGILLGDGNPPSIPGLVTPAQLSIVSVAPTFEWTPCDYTTSYEFYLAANSDLSDATPVDVGMATSYTPQTPLDEGTTYYWAVFSLGDGGTTWSEIREFQTSGNPPPTATLQTVWTTQGSSVTVALNGTGGAGTLARIITALPAHGELYQYNNGDRGTAIDSVPTDVTDANGQVIFYINDGVIGTNRGNFEFAVRDTNNWESDPSTVTINVYPAPTVETAPVIVTGPTTATCGGNVILGGGSEVVARGVCWGTAPNPTVAGSHTSDSNDVGEFTSSITGLTFETLYYIRAYAQNGLGIGYGMQYSFVAGLPQVTTDSVRVLDNSSAFASATLIGAGGDTLQFRGICYAEGHAPTTSDSKEMLTAGAPGPFHAYIYDLTPGTTYRMRAFAISVAGVGYGNEMSFTTSGDAPCRVYGYVRDGDGDGIDSVTMTGFPTSVMTDSTGYYGAVVPSGWSGSIKPVRSSYTFVPDSHVYDSVVVNIGGQNYVGTSILSGVEDEHTGVPRTYSLAQNFPNPFNPATEIQFGLPRAGRVVVSIYDIRGSEVITLVDKNINAGTFHVTWNGLDRNGRSVSTGVYFYRLQAGEFTQSKKMLLLK
ncbi:MAG: T9SS type A sorting domain-containing protein [Candidatus Zixiibacteriota bacterium]